MKNTKLKPCPFCGGEAKFQSYITEVAVLCLNCRAKIVYRYKTTQSVYNVIAAWNRRIK